MTQCPDVLVVGAGVTGLTTAVCLAEQGLPVLVRAAEAPRDTTSAVALAVLMGPSLAPPEEADSWPPIETTMRWHREGVAEFTALAGRPGTGVSVMPGRWASHREGEDIAWARDTPGYRPCTPEEHAGFAAAFWMSAPVVDMRAYLDHLAARLAAAGGVLEIARVASLAEAAEQAPVVVNCTGAEARHLADDPEVHAVRGQHVVVENPGLDSYFFQFSRAKAMTMFMPHGDRLVLGGNAGRDDWSREPDPVQTEEIIARCAAVEPRIAAARVLGVEVGFRASRSAIRLAEERLGDTRVVHNYGHSGAAVAFSWPCARAVARQVLQPARV
ncbi:FAD-dependent oxidoreductase [Sphaerisporangium aureirubrum]|uniref:D-amino-acid oxidase n=1 Tax=Sphaerisporangium aureirubrum TaxID=1544736 RepID=A0ABW1NEL3_9ACTN